MYVPRFNAWDDAAGIRAMVADVGTAQLVTVGADGFPLATLLPVIWDSTDRGDRLVFHVARANEHWRSIAPGSPGLAVVTGPDAYVSPSWYASKLEHGRVVPTWNYSVVQLAGRVTVHDDPAWVREAVTRLTQVHEGVRAEPWAVSDAPGTYVDGQLRAIVGLEMRVERVEAKAKLSQNRSDADRSGVVAGIRAEGPVSAQPLADAMER